MENINLATGILFSLQLWIAEAAFLVDRPKKPRFVFRIVVSTIAYFAIACLMFLIFGVHGQGNFLLSIIFYFGVFIISMVKIGICYDLEPIEILFVGTGGYAIEHITFALTRTLQFVMGWEVPRISLWTDRIIFRILAYVLAAILAYFLLIRKNRLKEEFKKNDIRLVEMALFILISAIVLSVFYSYSLFESESPFLSYIICPIYSMLCCVLVLIMEYYVFRENRLSREKETMEQMLQIAQAQQKSSKEAINIINMKCHDLKHQMTALAKMEDAGTRSEYIEDMRRTISIYDATYHTGCEALDYVLREKTLLSEEYGVTFSCIADGNALSFMHVADIYALMGNVLDNALESVIKVEEEQRIISLQITRQKQMVAIHVENTCNEVPDFQDGLPITVKEDKNYHGFGVKSIRYIAEKYQGDVVMRAYDNQFFLDILFPGQ